MIARLGSSVEFTVYRSTADRKANQPDRTMRGYVRPAGPKGIAGVWVVAPGGQCYLVRKALHWPIKFDHVADEAVAA